jgi:hypothetical protein
VAQNIYSLYHSIKAFLIQVEKIETSGFRIAIILFTDDGTEAFPLFNYILS